MRFLNLGRSELFFVSVVALVLISVTSLPYVFGYMSAPTSTQYLGASHFLPGDYYSYLTWITEGSNGNLFMRDLYAPEYPGGYLFHPLFLLLGLFVKFLHISAPLVYHLGRVVFIGIFSFCAYGLYSLVTKDITERRMALLLLVSSSGFGFFLGSSSADITMPEINIFLSSYLSLLNLASLSFALLFVGIALRYFHKRNWSMVISGAVLLSAVALIHTYDLILFGAILFVYSLVLYIIYKESEFLGNLLWVFALVLPAVIWQSVVLANDDALSLWYFVQVSTFSPNFFSYIAGLGALFFLALWGMRLTSHRLSRESIFFFTWIGVSFLLLYNPVFPMLQRKFIEGIQIPLAFFAGIALLRILRIQNSVRFVGLVLLLLSLVTNIEIIYKDMFLYPPKEKPRSISLSEMRAIEWIKNNTDTHDVVLSEVFMGNIIPALAGRSVYMGHNDQTLNFDTKNHLLGYAFMFGPKTPRLWAKLLNNGHIQYIVEDEEVRALGTGIAHVKGITPVFEDGTVTIYKTIP